METNVTNKKCQDATNEKLEINNDKKKKERWYVLPSPPSTAMNGENSKRNQLRPIHFYIYTFILNYANLFTVSIVKR